ncbi:MULTISPECIES: 1-phosphofructokinase [Halomicrobium]|uniref:1-phosphofructokinase n=2 Tax=Halomicrobium mukohataei TaxID=57705 RepID=C7NZJ9_HALMD|nr:MULTISPECIES: 1-phosphofructokinase [Halomicrobium]ACV48767.1 1-phosphofructokinase [Halomicrobium mukohataei DSM 12286]QCD64197.1 1-phosphofructokinase [Halomicrobium mukohataei]QFR19003.1 hexose kinase [Halomicrobium sp. ZPS1]
MILTVTYNPAVDQTVTFDEPLASETVNRATDAQFDAGGKGINVSQFLTAMDTATVATGLLGGFTGTFVTEQLEAADIPAEFVTVDEPTRLNTTALAGGADYKLNQAGPTVDASAVDDLVDRIADHEPARVLVGGSLPPGLESDAIDRIASSGPWRTAVDVEGETLRTLSADYALCKPNREELAAATETTVETVEECVAAASALGERGFERVVASLGADGAVLVGPDGAVHAEPLAVDVVDTVGAGDALLSGVLASLERGESDELALATGVAVASRVVSQAGTGVPDLDGVFEDRSAVETRRL